MLDDLLPPGVVCAEAYDDDPAAVLFPEETAAVARAVAGRRREFTTGRACARRALAGLGYPAAPLTRGPRGEPQWPPGVVGSITHCAGYRAAAVAPAATYAGLGIDAEPNEPVPDGVRDLIARPEELDRLRELARVPAEVAWDRLLFCAKEAVYKTWYPLTRRWLDFSEASIEFDPGAGSFAVTLLVSEPGLETLHGRWIARGGLLAAAIAHPAR